MGAMGGGAGEAGGVGATGGSTGGLGGGPDGGGDADTHSCGVGILADSICDFTGEQGRYGWSYGFIEPHGANTFVPMSIYLPIEKRWYAGTAMWTHIGDMAMHGNGTLTSGGMMPVEQWAVRRWQSSVSGTIKVDVKAYKLNASAGQEGSGVMTRVVVDGVSVWSQRLEPTDGVGVQASVSADVNVGSTVDLVLDPYMEDDRNDETYFSATITQ